MDTPVSNNQYKFNESKVNHPAHYNQGQFETIVVIEDWELTFCLGNAVKYISRLGYKDSDLQEINKALWYTQRELNTISKNIYRYNQRGSRLIPLKDVINDWGLSDNLTEFLTNIYNVNFLGSNEERTIVLANAHDALLKERELILTNINQ